MGNFFIDESIHETGAFIIAACVYAETDLQADIGQIFQDFGQDSKQFEFKSSANYSKNPELRSLRSTLKNLLIDKCKLGVVVLPLDARPVIAMECLNAVTQFIEVNEIKVPVQVYLDQGMSKINDKLTEVLRELKSKGIEVFPEQDSKKIKSIQLADLAAHILAIQLKGQMGLINKMVKIEGDPVYEEVELTFEMFAAIRYCFFREAHKIYDPSQDMVKASTFKVAPFGLYLSSHCDKGLKEIAYAQFSTIYLGCVH